jgi:hypothetical protein
LKIHYITAIGSNNNEIEEMGGASLLPNSDSVPTVIDSQPRDYGNVAQTSASSNNKIDSHCNIPASEHAAAVFEKISSNEKASLNSLQYSRNQILWKIEITCMATSFGLFIAAFIVLRIWDHHPLPNLRFSITPNAIIGLLASFGQLFLMIPVSSSIGQLKWLQALQKRPLKAFQALDEASRGPWGSFLLLVRRDGG